MVNLVYSHCCSVEPRLFRVGDDKQYFVYMCPKCFRTPVENHEARTEEAIRANIALYTLTLFYDMSQQEPTGIMYTKVNGTYKAGEVYRKINGTWRKAKAVYKKVNGTWRISKTN